MFQDHRVGTAFFCFFVLGWTYYMVGTILMRGSIFEPMRQWIVKRAGASWFWAKVREMLGCMMCTATEAALWTLGVATLVLGLRYSLTEQLISSFVGRTISLPWAPNVALTVGIAFAASLAVSGQAWVIKTVFEHRERKFLELRDEFREREQELLTRLGNLETSPGARDGADVEFDLT